MGYKKVFISSPCIKKCNLKNDKCTGCYRNLFDIINWSKYSEVKRMSIMEKIKNNL